MCWVGCWIWLANSFNFLLLFNCHSDTFFLHRPFKILTWNSFLHVHFNCIWCGMVPTAISFLQLHQTNSWSESLITFSVRYWKSLHFQVTQKASCINIPSPWYSNLWLAGILIVNYFPLFLVIFCKCVCFYIDFTMLITYF